MDKMQRAPPVPHSNEANNADSWQYRMTSSIERNRYILDNELWVDCSFLVGREPNQKEFKCHRVFLAKTSATFEQMLYGEDRITVFPIALPDVQPEAFQAMLDYTYCDEINIPSREHASTLMYVAKKYNLRHLVQKCQKYLCSSSGRVSGRAP